MYRYVTSIIPHEGDFELDEAQLCFSDDEDNERVDKMVSSINNVTRFSNHMFKGGASKADVERMRDRETVIMEKLGVGRRGLIHARDDLSLKYLDIRRLTTQVTWSRT